MSGTLSSSCLARIRSLSSSYAMGPPLQNSTKTVRRPLIDWVNRFSRDQSGDKQENTNKTTVSDQGNSSPSHDGDKHSESAANFESLQKLLSEKEEFLNQKEVEIKDVKDKYMRSLAETENTRQRMGRQIEDAKKFGIQGFAKDLLEVADVLEKAIESVPKEEVENGANPHLCSLFEGLNMTENQLQKVFKKNGLIRINPVGEKFDPSFHEALFEVPGEYSGSIAVVSKVGYLLNGRTVRPAVVGVVKKS